MYNQALMVVNILRESVVTGDVRTRDYRRGPVGEATWCA